MTMKVEKKNIIFQQPKIERLIVGIKLILKKTTIEIEKHKLNIIHSTYTSTQKLQMSFLTYSTL